jgi:isopenicillin-N epimerase
VNKTGLSYVNQPIPLPVTTKEDFVERFWRGVTPRTKVICLSHITSATSLIFPIREICHRARTAGILTIIDGAHAPGQIPLNLEEIGADFYTGNCHKWLCAPKGSAFLYARPEAQKLVEPLVVSWGWDSPEPGPETFVNWLEWQGTRDIAAFLTVPTAIEFQAKHNWDEVRMRCHKLLAKTRQQIDQLTGLEPICPDSPDWFAQMATIRLPKCDEKAFQARLWDEFRVEVPLISWQNQSFIRVSVQGYTTEGDLAQLVEALKEVMSTN